MSELKNCPFCGGKTVELFDAGKNTDVWFIQCDTCYATFPHFDSKAEAIQSWNRRGEE